MQRLFRRFIAAGSLLLLPNTAGWSCGPSLVTDETRFNLFRPADAGTSPLEPFYYTEAFLNGYTPDPAGKDYARNCAEWRAFTGGAVDTAAIYTVQYATEPDDFLRGHNTGEWRALDTNNFIRWLRKKANKDAMRYMAFAKRVEWTQTGDTDPWEERKLAASDVGTLAKEAEKEYGRVSSTFLKSRYAFQILKTWYYAGNFIRPNDTSDDGSLSALYKNVLLGKPTVVAGWAALYYGLMLRDTAARMRELVRAFDASEEKKVFVYQQLSREDLDDFLRVEKDPALRTAAMAMKSAKNYGPALDDLKAVAAADPQSKYLPLLVGREVAKIEDWLLSPSVLGFESALRTSIYDQTRDWDARHSYDTAYLYYANLRREKDRSYARDLRNFLESHAVNSGPQRTYLLLAAAHLYAVEEDFEKSHAILSSLSDPAEKSLRIQRIIGLAVAEMHLEDVREPRVQNALLARFSALEHLGLHPYNSTVDWETGGETDETKDDLSEVLLLLSHRFEERGDHVRASLLSGKAGLSTNHYDYNGWHTSDDTSVSYGAIAYLDRAGSPADVDTLLRMKHAAARTAFDAYLAPKHWQPDNFYRDLKGTLLFREGRYREALTVFEMMPDDFWETTYEYRHYLQQTSIGSVGALLPGGWDEKKIHLITSKKALLREMLSIQDSATAARTPAAKARWMLKWGHAQYNTSYYGNAWMMFNYGNSTHETGNGWGDVSNYRWAAFTGEPSLRYREKYYGLRDATAAYREALRLASRDKETAATAVLMLAHCDALVHPPAWAAKPLPAGVSRSWSAEPPAEYVSPYLAMLRKVYGGTKLYEQAELMCPDVREN